jgi:predicted protein tyrosine phosphatase
MDEMRILILSQEEAITYTETDKENEYVIISITENPAKPVKLTQNNSMLSVLRLYFDDIDLECPEGIPMSQKDAQDIQEFVDNWKDKVNTIIVHCAAGISRSAGVAAALSMVLNGNDNEIWDSKHYLPNTHCCSMVMKAFGMSLEDYCKQKYAHLCEELRKDEENDN